MERHLNNFKIFVCDDYDGMSKTAARIIADEIKALPNGVFGFATGGTPVGTYKELINIRNTEGLDFSGITSFNLDEYYPIGKDSDQSYSYFMRKNLFDSVNIKPENINIPDGEAYDYETECTGYSAKINKCGGIRLQLLGIGLNGHIGFNEPDNNFARHTHFVNLAPATIEANSRFFKTSEEVPRNAITMGIREIMSADRILLLVNGISKAQIIYDVIFGLITPQVPASVLQLHRDVTIVMDKEASGKIKHII